MRGRNPGGKRTNPRIIILCEGKTEVRYFEKFKLQNPALEARVGEKRDPQKLVNELIEIQKQAKAERNFDPDNDQYWCVFDRDDIDNSALTKAKNKADKHQIEIAFSNPCFELWYLLHFGYTTAQYSTADELIKRALNKHLSDYAKTRCYFSLLKARMKDAIKNAKKLAHFHEQDGKMPGINRDCNPYTTVHLLVQVLSPELQDLQS